MLHLCYFITCKGFIYAVLEITSNAGLAKPTPKLVLHFAQVQCCTYSLIECVPLYSNVGS